MVKMGPKPSEFHPEYSLLPETGERARQLDKPLYFTGRRCLRGHLAPRYTSSSNCVDCIVEKRKLAGRSMRAGQKFRNQQQDELAILALANGQKVYSGKPCPKGHVVRRATTGNCIECESINNQKRKDRVKWKRIYDLYGLTKNCVEEMLAKQQNQCAICLISFDDANMHIDHCHESGKVRALLCNKCNQAIGLFEESHERLGMAMLYLKAHKNAS